MSYDPLHFCGVGVTSLFFISIWALSLFLWMGLIKDLSILGGGVKMVVWEDVELASAHN